MMLFHQIVIRNKLYVKLVMLDYFFSIIVLGIPTLTVLPSIPLELTRMCKLTMKSYYLYIKKMLLLTHFRTKMIYSYSMKTTGK